MNTYDRIAELAKQNNGILLTRELAKNAIETWYLTDLVRQGRLERISRGIYLDPSYENFDEYFILQLKNDRCVYSYSTALYLNGLTERIPYQIEVTVPRGYNPSHIKGKAVVHSIRKNWYDIGITKLKTVQGNEVKAYDAERTICDLVRDRNNQDTEIFSKTCNVYLRRKTKDIWKLRDYAQLFGISEKIESILELINYE